MLKAWFLELVSFLEIFSKNKEESLNSIRGLNYCQINLSRSRINLWNMLRFKSSLQMWMWNFLLVNFMIRGGVGWCGQRIEGKGNRLKKIYI